MTTRAPAVLKSETLCSIMPEEQCQKVERPILKVEMKVLSLYSMLINDTQLWSTTINIRAFHTGWTTCVRGEKEAEMQRWTTRKVPAGGFFCLHDVQQIPTHTFIMITICICQDWDVYLSRLRCAVYLSRLICAVYLSRLPCVFVKISMCICLNCHQ